MIVRDEFGTGILLEESDIDETSVNGDVDPAGEVKLAQSSSSNSSNSDGSVSSVALQNSSEIVVALENGSIARLPAGTDISNPRANGTDLQFLQPDGSIIVITNGAVQGLVLFLGDIEIPAETVAALLASNDIETAAGPGGGSDGAHGNFNNPGSQSVGEGLEFDSLLPNSNSALQSFNEPAGVTEETVQEEETTSTPQPKNVAPETDEVITTGDEDAAFIAVNISGDDDDGTVAEFRIISLPENGKLYSDAALTNLIAAGDTVAAVGNGATVFFVPGANFNGDPDFTYTSIDDEGIEDATPATATITVTSVNDAPETDDASAAGEEDAVSIEIALSGDDVDGTVAEFRIVSLPENGKLYSDAALTNLITAGDTVAAVGNGATVFFVPDTNFNGDPDFTYTSIDDEGIEDATPATATITVTSVNDAPETDDVSAAGEEDAVSIEIALSGDDVDGTVAEFRIVSLPENGKLYSDAALTNLIAAGDTIPATGNGATVFFVPDANFNGDPSFTYTSIDDEGIEDATPATAAITVTAVNDAPETDDASATGEEDAVSIEITLSGDDVDGTIAEFRIIDLPQNGRLFSDAALTVEIAAGDSVAAAGNGASVFFVPDAQFNGTPSFTYTSVDDLGLEDVTPATANITVTTVNDAPEISVQIAEPTFTETEITTSADEAISVFAVDVNGDGFVDVLSASQDDDTVSVFLNDGAVNPAFREVELTTSADGAFSVFAVDVNGDGFVDVLAASFLDNTVSVFLNDGAVNPAFREVELTTSANGAPSVFAVDVNGDGFVDVLSASFSDDTVSLFLNDGDADPAFLETVLTTNADGVASVFAVDVNGDGFVDVLSASQSDDTVSLFLNDGNPTNPGFREIEITTSANGARFVFAVDVNGDGFVDVLTASRYDDTVSVFLNDGDQDNPTFREVEITTSADDAFSVFAVDVNGDGFVDVLTASSGDDSVSVFLNDGDQDNPTFREAEITTSADGAVSVFAVDVNGDGFVDVLAASFFDDTVSVFLNSVSAIEDTAFTFSTASGNVIAISDVDAGNGDLEITLSVANGALTLSGNAGLAFTNGDGTDDATMTFTGTLAAINAALDGLVYAPTADFNGPDGLQIDVSDLGNTGAGGPQTASQTVPITVISVNDAPETNVASGTGLEDADSIAIALSGSDIDSTIAEFRIIDLPQNGRLFSDAALTIELAAGDSVAAAGNGASVFFVPDADFNGTPSFTYAAIDDLGLEDATPATANITVTAVNDAPEISVSIANPTFTETEITNSAYDAVSVFAVDVNGDGFVDVASASVFDDSIRLFLNDGAVNPTFREVEITTGADRAYSVFAVDVNGDGFVDVLSASQDDDTVSMFLNNGAVNPGFTEIDVTTSADGVSSVFAVDVDGDGFVDVLAASKSGNTVSVFLNDGMANPTFTEVEITNSALGAQFVYAVDVNGDGFVDVLVASLFDDTVSVFFNDGAVNPGFTETVLTTTADGANSVFAVDVNGDGFVDVLAASRFDGTVSVFFNDGAINPNFTEVEITTSASAAASVFAVDVNGDGFIDVLAASYIDDTVSVFLNDGAINPTFTETEVSTSSDNVRSVFAVDVNGDGLVDVLSASANDNTVSVFLNDNGPATQEDTAFTFSSASGNVIAISDVDAGNGDMEITLSVANGVLTLSGTAGLAFTTGDGADDATMTFTGTLAAINAALDGLVYTPTADFNGPDGLQIDVSDLGNTGAGGPQSASQTVPITVISVNDAPETNVASGTGLEDADSIAIALSGSDIDSTIAEFRIIDLPQNGRLFADAALTVELAAGDSVAAAGNEASVFFVPDADFNGTPSFTYTSVDDQGLEDATPATANITVTAVNDAPVISVAIANPTFTETEITTTADGAFSVFAVDVNGDGFVDVMAASLEDDTVSVFLNDGAAKPGFTEIEVTTSADGAGSVFAVDVNGDGFVDVVSASLYDDTVSVFLNNGAAIPTFTETVLTTTANGAYSVFAFDINGDGFVDVLSASRNDGTVSVFFNDGAANPSFTEIKLTTTASAPNSVFAVDVNGDGFVDVVSASYNTSVLVFLNDGAVNPTFTEIEIPAVTIGRSSVFAVDVNGDGFVDAVSASFIYNTVKLFLNNGEENPTFTETILTTTAVGLASVHAVDVNGDGFVDVVAASYRDNTARVFLNDGDVNPTFTETDIITTADGVRSVFAVDVNGDGLVDVLSASFVDDTVSVFLNDGAVLEEDTAFTFSTASGNVIAVSDVDAGNGDMEITLSVANGVLTLSGNTGLTFSDGDGTDDATMTFTGTLAAINAALDGLVYTPTAEFNGSDGLQIDVSDLGNTGAGGPQTATQTVPIKVAPVNDAPSLDLDANDSIATGTGFVATFIEDGGAIAVADTDTLIGDIDDTYIEGATITLTNASDGADEVLSASGLPAGISLDAASTAANIILTGAASLADYQTAIAAIRYNNASQNPTEGDRIINVVVNDGDVDSNIAVSTITVEGVNNAPETNAVSGTGLEDAASITIALSGSDVDGAVAEFRIDSLPSDGTLYSDAGLTNQLAAGDVVSAVTNAANVFFVPDANFNGTPSFTYTATDNEGLEDASPATADITVTAVNDAPVANAVSVSTDEGNQVVITLSGSDIEGSNLTFIIQSPGSDGTLYQVTVKGDGSLTRNAKILPGGKVSDSEGRVIYIPNQGVNGTDNITYAVNDGTLTSNVATVTVTINPVNDAPTVDLDDDGAGTGFVATFTEGGGAVAISDTDTLISDVDDVNIEGATITLTNASDGVDEVLNLSGGLPGGISVDGASTPTNIILTGSASLADYQAAIELVQYNNASVNPTAGDRIINVVVNDGELDSNIAVSTITVAGVNDAPETNAATGTGAEGANSIAVALSGSDVDGSVASFRIIDLPANGTLYSDAGLTTVIAAGATVPATGNAANVFFKPDVNFNGTPSFTYASIDNQGLEDATLATANITVTAVNDAPAIDLDGDNSTVAGTGFVATFTEGGGAVAISDVDTIISDVDDANIEGATITLTNAADGVDEDISVSGLPAGISVDAGSTATNIILTGSASLADYQAAIELIQYNNASVNPTDGDRTIEVVVNDGELDSNISVSTITVASTNDAPETNIASGIEFEDATSIWIALSGSDTDGLVDEFRITSLPSDGTLYTDATLTTAFVLNGTVPAVGNAADVYFVPDANFNGTINFTYASVDDQNTADPTPATATITVISVNDNPVNTVPGNQTTNEDTDLIFTSLSVADVDAVPFNLQVDLKVTNGILTINSSVIPISGNGTSHIQLTGNLAAINAVLASNVIFTPQADFHGAAVLTMRAVDSENGLDFEGVNITVNPVNDAPVVDLDDNDSTVAGTGFVATFTEGGGAVAISDTDTIISDVDDTIIEGATITLTNASDGADEELSLIGILPVAITVDAASSAANIILIGSASLADYQAAIELIQYNNASDNPTAGDRTINVVVNDGDDNSNVALSTITVAGVNDAPETNAATGSGLEDAASITVALAGSDVDGAVTSFRIIDLPANGTLYSDAALNNAIVAGTPVPASGNVANVFFVPDANFNGTPSFTYASIDDQGLEDTTPATANITVSAANDAPESDGSVTNVFEGITSVTVRLSGSDTDGWVASFRIIDLPANGTLYSNPTLDNAIGAGTTLPASGNTTIVFFVPDADFHGISTFSYASVDNLGLEDVTPAIANITVNPINDAPVLDLDDNDSASAGTGFVTTFTEGGGAVAVADADTLIGDVDDTNIESATITLTNAADGADEKLVVSGGLPGGITVDAASTATQIILTGSASLVDYQAAIESIRYNNASQDPTEGDRTIEIVVNDGDDNSNVAVSTITVAGVNDAPATNAATGTGLEDASSITVALAGSDVDGTVASFRIIDLPANGTLYSDGALNNAIVAGAIVPASGNAANVFFVPDANFNGTPTFTYAARDDFNFEDTSPATATITVTAVNDAPELTVILDKSTEFTETVITTSADGAISVFAADMNGDGFVDVLSASAFDDTVSVFFNNGAANPTFTESVVTNSADGARSVFAVDVNGDGFVDVLSASAGDDTVSIFLNDGAPNPTFTETVVTSIADGAASVFATDVNGDGFVDVVIASFNVDRIAVFFNDGNPAIPDFTGRLLSTSADGARSVYATDVNGDGFVDVLSASVNDDTVSVFFNDGNLLNPGFTETVVTSSANGAFSVFAADMNGDGFVDVLSASLFDDTVSVFLNDGNQADPTFTEIEVTTSADGPRSVYAVDVNGDGFVDVVSASYYDNTVSVFLNDGAINPTFTETEITTSADGAISVFAMDVNGDGFVDVLSASSDDDTVSVFLNDGNGAVPEDTTFIFSAASGNQITVADVDLGGGDMLVTLGVTNGTLSLSGIAGLAFTTGNGTSDTTMTFTGTLASINAALDGLVYTPDLDFYGQANLQIDISDQSNSGSGGAQTDTQTVPIDVFPVNDAAVLDLDANDSVSVGTGFAATFTEGGAAVAIADTDTLITDIDDTLIEKATVKVFNAPDGAAETLTVTNASGLTVSNNGTGTVTITGSATLAVYQSVIASIQYNNSSLNPTAGDHIINVVLNDVDVNSNTAVSTITVVPVNNAPMIDLDSDDSTSVGSGFAATFTGGSGGVVIVDADLAITDIDGTNIESVTVTLTNAQDGGAESLTVINAAGLSVQGSGTGTVTITGSATLAVYQSVIASIQYDNNAAVPTSGQRIINVVVNDGELDSNTAVSTITVAGPGDAPETNAVAGAGIEDDASITIALSGSDGGSVASFRIVDLPANGTLFSDAALTNQIAAGDTITATGNAADVFYVPDTNFNGTPSFTYASIDNQGFEDATPATATITITAVNDAPEISLVVANPTFTEVEVTTSANGARSVFAVDVNGDGFVDVLSASVFDDTVSVFLNDGAANPTFTEVEVTTSADGARSVHAVDVNGDGFVDVVSASVNDDTVSVFLNDGAAIPTFTEIVVTDTANGANSVFAVDVNNDGFVDVVSGAINDDRLAIYYNDGNQANPSFTRQVLSNTADGINSVFATDVNGDGFVDILASDGDSSRLIVRFTDGNPYPGLKLITKIPFYNAQSIYAADLNGDGLVDVLATDAGSGGKISMLLNGGAGNNDFTKIVVGDAPNGPRSVFAADVNGDGFVDVLAASSGDDTVSVFLNDGAAIPTFTETEITTSADGAFSVFATDVNGDGLVDVLSASSNDDTVSVFLNNLSTPEDTALVFSAASGNVLSIVDVDAGVMQATLAVTNGTLSLSGTAELNFTVGDGTGDATMTFTGTLTAINAALDGLVFMPDLEFSGQVDLQINISDQGNTGAGGMLSDTQTIPIIVAAVNDVTALDLDANDSVSVGTGFAATFTEGSGAVAIADTDTVITDVDDTLIESATVTLPNALDGAAETLTVTNASGLTVTNNGTGIVTITGSATFAVYQSVIASIQYNNSSLNPTAGDHVINVVINDGDDNSNTAVSTITVVPVNNAPIIDLDTDDSTSVGTGFEAPFTGGVRAVAIADTDLSVTDGDLNIESATITLTNALDGGAESLTVTNTAGLVVQGSGTGTVTITGSATPAVYQSIIASILYDNNVAVPTGGQRTINIVVNDGSVDSNIAVSTITVAGPGDAPETNAGAGTGLEDAVSITVSLLGSDGGSIASFRVSSLPTNGTLFSDAGLTNQIAAGDTVTATGNAADVFFVPDANFFGTPSFTYAAIDDQGFEDATPATATITVTAVNEAPEISVSSTDLNFTGQTITNSAISARSVFAVDVNGDGFVDVLSASFNDDTVSVFLNDGAADPTFTESVVTNSANGARSVFAVDVNGDGFVDVLSASRFDDTVSVFLNDGATNPTFTEMVVTTSADHVTSVFAVDVNGDGFVDVLSASIFDDTVSVFLNDGAADPTFTEKVVTTSANGAISVFAVDVNGDGFIDVLSASSYDNTVSVFLNDGAIDPTFTEKVITTSADSARSVFAVDVNGDGFVDVLSASFNDDTVSVFLNDGAADPTFTEIVVTNSANGARSVFAVDVNGDGFIDVLSASSHDKTVSVFLNDGAANPTFIEIDATTSANGANSVYAVDVNGDGFVDVLSTSFRDNKVSVLFSDGNGATLEDTAITFSAASGNAITVADIDVGGGDMQASLAVANGTLSLSGIAGLNFTAGNGTADATMTFTGTLAAVNAALDGLVYTPDLNFNGQDNLQIDISDLGNTGSGGAQTDTQTVPISVVSVIEAPVFDLDASGNGTGFATTFTESGGAVAIADTDTIITDEDDTNIDSAIIRLMGVTDGIAETISLSGVLPAGVLLQNQTATSIILTGSASLADYQAAIELIRYNNASQDPTAGDREISVVVNDGDANSNRAVSTVTVVPVNNAPVIDLDGDDSTSAGTGYEAPFTSGLGVVAIVDTDISIADFDDTNIESATITLTNAQDGFAESLTVTNASGLAVQGSGTGTVTITGSATFAVYQSVIASIEYDNNAAVPTGGQRIINVVVNDGELDSNTAVSTIMVAGPGDAPETSAAADTGLEDAASIMATLSGSDGGSIVSFRIMDLPANGILFSDAALTNQIAAGDTITATGNAADVFFVPDANYNGTPSFTYASIDDQGFEDASPAIATITVTAVNDAPEISVPSTGLAFTQQIVSNSADNVRSVFAVDVNGDGFVDVLSASVSDDTVSVYLSDGSANPAFTKTVVTSSADSARSVFAVDVNNDGYVDVLSASHNDDTVSVFLNDGNQANPGFTETVVTTSADGALSVFARDVNGDGFVDVLTASRIGDTVSVFINNGASSPSFTETVVTNSADGVQSVYAIDINGDGFVDVLSASNGDDTISVFLNDGAANPTFTETVVTNSADSARSVYAVDVNGDGFVDVLSASHDDNTVSVFINNGAALPIFTEIEISTAVNGAYSVFATDVNGDGFVDVLSASLGDNTLSVFLNDGAANPNFTETVVTTSVDGPTSVFATDVNGDGFVDVLSASNRDDTVSVFLNDGNLMTLEDTAFTFSAANGNAISVFDVDVETGDMQATIGVTNGTLSLSGFAGLAFTVGDGTGDTTMTFTGTQAAINAALDGLVYTPELNFNGQDNLQIDISDQGNTGSGGALTDTQTVPINVAAVNDVPTLASLDDVTFLENTVNAAPQIIDADIVFDDIDSGDLETGTLTVSGFVDGEDTIAINNEGTGAGEISVDGANVRFGNTIIGAFTGGTGANDLVVNFVEAATPAAVDALLQNLTYANSLDAPTADRTLTITVTDGDGGSVAADAVVSVTGEGDVINLIDLTPAQGLVFLGDEPNDNTLVLNQLDVLNTSTVVVGGTTILTVNGNAGDAVSFTDAGWTGANVNGTITVDGITYNRYTNGNAEVRIEVGVTSSVAGDPIVFDLDGDGFEFAEAIEFDLDADGVAETLTNWVGSEDGLLVMDLDGSGQIEDGSEVVSPNLGDGGHFDSLDALRSLDSNLDGILDTSDLDFDKLQIWQDADSDGVTDAGELNSLAQLGIASIDLDAELVDFTIDDTQVLAQGTATLENGDALDYLEVSLSEAEGAEGLEGFLEDPAGDEYDLSSLLDDALGESTPAEETTVSEEDQPAEASDDATGEIIISDGSLEDAFEVIIPIDDLF